MQTRLRIFPGVLPVAAVVVACAASALFVSIPALAKTSEMVKELDAPCVEGDRNQGLRACKVMITDAQARLKKRIACQVKAYYLGCTLGRGGDFSKYGEDYCDKLVDGKINECPPGAEPFPKETCNMYPGTFNNGEAEMESNHLGKSCGSWTHFSTSLGGGCNVTVNVPGDATSREDAYTRGALIQALNCHYEQVKNEVEKRKLSLTGVSGEEGVCALAAKDFESKMKGDFATKLKELTHVDGGSFSEKDMSSGKVDKLAGSKKLAGHSNIGDIENCTGSEKDAIGQGHVKQSACQLHAMRLNLEAAYAQLAACEVFSRAERSFERFLGSRSSPNQVRSEVIAALNSSKCMSSEPSDCSEGHVLSGCYMPRFYNVFRRKADAIWNSNVCQ